MKVSANKRLFRVWRVFAVALVLFVIAVVVVSTRAHAAGWAGKVATVDGVKTVTNPATGFAPAATVKLPELWRVGGDTDNEDELFGVISSIRIDTNGDVYLLDSQLSEVKVYSKDGEFLRTIGHEGEGPGEFRRPSAMFFTDDGKVAVVQLMPGKIVLLSKDGKPAGDFPIPQPADGGFQLVQGADARGGNIVLLMGRQKFDQTTKKWSRDSFLASVTPEGKQTAEYCTKENVIDMAAPVLDDAQWDTFERRWAVGPDGKVYACKSYDDYAITVYDKTGKVDMVITKDSKHLPRTAREKDIMTKAMTFYSKMIPNCKTNIHDMAKDIDFFYLRDDGSMWVMPASGARNMAKGTLGTFDVFNPQGQFVKNVTLQGQGKPLDDLYVFEKDRFYVVTSFLTAAMSAQGVEGIDTAGENAEPMSVICYKLEGDNIAAK
ncbi:MAG TPA: 6-bladed beta-propeller [Candidatus Krumholzibacteria bacterium]|nr:6-bladed beta-propeller [Candidatus Krumholzibacteria bacterium]